MEAVEAVVAAVEAVEVEVEAAVREIAVVLDRMGTTAAVRPVAMMTSVRRSRLVTIPVGLRVWIRQW